MSDVGVTVKKSEDFSEWYTQVVVKSGFADYAPVKGCMIFREHSYGIWEKIQEIFNEKIKAELDFVVYELEKSTKESPLNFRSYLKLGQLYNAYSLFDSSKVSDAERILQRTIELSPTNQQGYWSLAQAKIYQGKFEEAIFLAQKAVDLEPKLERSHAILIQIAKIFGDFELAEKKIQEAIKVNPEWENDLRKILGST